MQLEESEKRLHDSKSKLARLRTHSNGLSSKGTAANETKNLKVERRSTSPINISEDSSRHQPQSRPELLIPSVNPKVSQHINSAKFGAKPSNGSSSQSGPSVSTQSYSAMKVKGDKPSRFSTEPEEEVKIQDKGTKRKFGEIHLLHSFTLFLHRVIVRACNYMFATFLHNILPGSSNPRSPFFAIRSH